MLSIKENYEISLYEELSYLDEKKNVVLVIHRETKDIRIIKRIEVYNKNVYVKLKELKIQGIPKLYFVGEEKEHLVVIEEYVHGKSLKRLCEEEKPLKEDDVVKYMIKLCEIVERIHSIRPKIIHRDIKPENIIMTIDGIIKLIDFNTAKEYTDTKRNDTVLLGTHEFAAPEQYGFMQSDERTDVYAIGATMNYLLTGESPKKKLYEGRLSKIIGKCTNFDPKERYKTVRKIKDKLLKLER